MRKPNADIFELVINENNLKLDETIFIDDSIQHIEGAKKVGLNAILLEKGKTIAIEIKASKTYHPNFFKGLNYYAKLSGTKTNECFLIYAGDSELKTSNGVLINWANVNKI